MTFMSDTQRAVVASAHCRKVLFSHVIPSELPETRIVHIERGMLNSPCGATYIAQPYIVSSIVQQERKGLLWGV
jgi:hypothetical protein